MRITSQDRSTSYEGGLYLSARVNGSQRGAGFRLSVGSSELDDSATKQRVAAELAIAQIMADYYHIDLFDCPCLGGTGIHSGQQALASGPLMALRNSSAAQLSAQTPAAREALARAALKALSYMPQEASPTDAEALRSATLRFRRDESLTTLPGTAAGLTADDLVYLRNAVVRRLGPDASSSAMPSFGGLDLTMFSGGKALALNSKLSVTVNVPVAGHLTCAYRSDANGKWYVVFPNSLTNTLTAVSRRTPVDVPTSPGGVGARVLTLTEPGLHSVYCVETTTALVPRLIRELDFLGPGVVLTEAQLSEYLRKQAGSTWITDGQIVLEVAKPRRPDPAPAKFPASKGKH